MPHIEKTCKECHESALVYHNQQFCPKCNGRLQQSFEIEDSETDLITQTESHKGTQLATVADVSQDVRLVARNADEMKAATTSMSLWFKAKQEMAAKEANDLDENVEIAARNNWKLDALTRQAKLARKRMEFYEKCRAASEAGFCIVPNMPCSLFAIRTTRVNPEKHPGRKFDDRTQRSNSPALGIGQHVDARPVEYFSHDEPTAEKNRDGTIATRSIYTAEEFQEIEFPISIAHPEVMSTTAEAMALKCFDELAICVGSSDSLTGTVRNADRQKRGDPLVLGIIRKPGRTQYNDQRVTFLIGWYLNTREI